MKVEQFCTQAKETLDRFEKYHKKHQKESGLSPEMSAIKWMREFIVYLKMGDILK